ncbi:MAG: apolipoprotein N-acyltransferase [Parvularculaceae bacterium]|nr:apolipoprotein N-acyltransferase [Parvularculaceae bacterium]
MDVSTSDAAAAPARSIAARLDRLRLAATTLSGWPRRGAALAAGIVAALAFAPLYWLPLMALGFSALLLLIGGAAAGPRPLRAAFFLGWLFGFGYFLVGIYWMAFSFFVQAEQFAWMAPFAVTGMPAFLALFFGAAAALTVASKQIGPRRALVFVAVFSTLEYARGHVLTGLPWNLPAQALAGSAALGQTAAIYGAYGLSVVVMLAAVAPAALSGPRGLLKGLGASVAIVVALWGFGAARLSVDDGVSADIIVRIVQPNIPQRDRIDNANWTDNFLRHVDLSKAPAPSAKRLFIVWPENAVPWLAEQPEALAHLAKTLPADAALLAGTVRSEKRDGRERFFNTISAYLVRPTGLELAGHYDKHHLVPFGEYLPMDGLLRAVGLAQLAPYDDGFTPGPGPRVLSVAGTRFAPLICYETIFPNALFPKGDRPDWLVTATNDSWFGDSSGPLQHLDQARLRSIETGLAMARSANSGVSALIDARGRYVAKIPLYKTGVFEAPLPKPAPATLYSRVGDVLFWGMVALIAAASLLKRPRALVAPTGD